LSVYTPVSESELVAWLGNYSVGTLAACAPIKAEVAAGQVVLTGPTVDARYITEAVRLVRAVEGVTSVESRIVPLGFHPAEPL